MSGEVPYFTNENPAKYCGHIWRQKDSGGRWGFMWEVMPPHDEEPIAYGWRATQQQAEEAMNAVLKERSTPHA